MKVNQHTENIDAPTFGTWHGASLLLLLLIPRLMPLGYSSNTFSPVLLAQLVVPTALFVIAAEISVIGISSFMSTAAGRITRAVWALLLIPLAILLNSINTYSSMSLLIITGMTIIIGTVLCFAGWNASVHPRHKRYETGAVITAVTIVSVLLLLNVMAAVSPPNQQNTVDAVEPLLPFTLS